VTACERCGAPVGDVTPWRAALDAPISATLGECACGAVLLLADADSLVIAKTLETLDPADLVRRIEFDDAFRDGEVFDEWCEWQISSRLSKQRLLDDYVVEVRDIDKTAVVFIEVKRGCECDDQTGHIEPTGWGRTVVFRS
jgi:hypothetical protein